MIRLLALIAGLSASSALKVPSRGAVDAKSECRSHDCCFWGSGSKTCLWSRYNAGKCTQTRLDVTAADARGAGAFSTLLLVGSMLLIAGFIVARKATRSAENEPLLATTA